MKKSLVIKVAVGVAALAVFGVLFMQSLQDARTTPYTVERRHLGRWTLALEHASAANQPLLVLRPVPELAGALFRQVFSRAMESLNAPTAAGIAVLLRGEFDRVVGDQITQDALVGAARGAGLETAAMTPTCLIHRRDSQPGVTKQAFVVLFDAPAIVAFRQRLGLDATELSPVLFVAGTGSDFNEWLPLRVNRDADCLAPIEVVQ